ncbi:PD40 domain-containing protein [Aquincola sp. S2]|uniref:PD40 domain-containing protein n=1 Tax=Pseudaquabacterium terrae TaxID=2732868 RepID=A0ABX2ER04_9BURK|nr:PD40 domain-containing protein [Aquabacterium terrae]NRF70946.1 PD40 domain-containing protein [Aquabacterium terrae]
MKVAIAAIGATLFAATSLALAEATPRRWTPAAIASDQYESSPTFSPDGRELVFMRADPAFRRYHLLVSRCEHGRWTAPEPPPFAATARVDEADPFISHDGRRLYYISTRDKPRTGGEADFDIWLVERQADGRWGTPQRLPEPVNSPASELLPREDAQGRLLFGSSRPGGLGLGDIYRATAQADGRWQVANFGAPVSSPANEYEAELSRDGRTLVTVADRGDRSHLYRYTLDVQGRWIEQGRVPARADVFQVGPLLSPRGERLLFAQADGARSGELFLIDLVPQPTEDWPPRCGP